MHSFTALLSLLSLTTLSLSTPLSSTLSLTSRTATVVGNYEFTHGNSISQPPPPPGSWSLIQYASLNCQGDVLINLTTTSTTSCIEYINGDLQSFQWQGGPSASDSFLLTNFGEVECSGDSIGAYGTEVAGCFSLVEGAEAAGSFQIS